MPGFRSSLDCMVGSPADPALTAVPGAFTPGTFTPGTADDFQLQVFISGAGASDPTVIGLDQDIRLLIEAFMRRSRADDPPAAATAPASQPHQDTNIALHGLNLTSEQAGELRHLIRELVSKRFADQGATP